ncbi:hypothetical protein FHG87_021523 [Trinorchestia longiramus]|nr:hypothetical protein FHG87_021523 [Trinorchestia longiramus]
MRQKVENVKNKGPDGIKELYNFIQGKNRSNEVQIHELVVDGCKVSDQRQMVKAVVDFWEDIGGMNEPLIEKLCSREKLWDATLLYVCVLEGIEGRYKGPSQTLDLQS